MAASRTAQWWGLLSVCVIAALMSLPGCGLTLTVFGAVLGTRSSSDRTNFAPTASVPTPTGLVNDVIPIQMTLIDPEGDAVSIDVRWSTDGGVTYSTSPATGASGISGHSGITGLAASASGVSHTFYWNAFVDLGTLGLANNYTTVRIQIGITQFDDAGNTVSTADFAVYNRYTASVAGGQASALLNAVVTPGGLARRPNGNLLVADFVGQKVVEIDAQTGQLTVIAGTGAQGWNGDNILATTAQLDTPRDVALDPQGNVLICDTGNAAIRLVDATTGFITTIAGANGWGFFGDGGPAAGASLAGPQGLNVDLNGDLWIADTQNGRVRFVNRSTVNRVFTYLVSAGPPAVTQTVTINPGQIATLAGGGALLTENITPLAAHLIGPHDAYPLMFNLGGVNTLLGFIVADWGNDRVRVVNTLAPVDGAPTSVGNFYGAFIANGQIRTVAGGGVGGGAGGGVGDQGPALNAILRGPQKVESLFIFLLAIADTGNNRIRLVATNGIVGIIDTIAGTGASGFSGDGRFPQLASLASPMGLLIDPSINIVIGDSFNGRVRLINSQLWQSVYAIASNDVIGVGGTGSVTRGAGAGTAFTSSNIGHVQYNHSVSATSGTDAVAVGDQGNIRRWNGAAWNAETSGTALTLHGVDAISTSDNVAVGQNGLILRWNGSAWTQQGAGATASTLRGVYAVSGSNIFAAGDAATVLNFNGSTWSVVNLSALSLPANTDFLAVHGTSGGDVFVVGSDGGNPSLAVVIHWNGSTWTDLTAQIASDAAAASVTAGRLNAVYVATASSVVAVADSGFITTYNGSTFAFPASPTSDDLRGVHGTGASDVYVIGSSDTLLHFNGTQWNTLVPNSSIRFAGATVQAGMIDSLTQPPTLSTVAVISPDGVVVESNGDVLFSNSTQEVFRLDIATRAITSVAGTGGPGFSGDGGSASPASALVPDDLHAVFGASASDVWAVGERSVMIRFNGTAWSVFQAGTDGAAILNDIHGLAANNIWAVGDGGVILHYDGTAWTAQTSPTTDDLRGVFAVDATNVFAVGRRGVILHFDGTTWTQQTGGGVTSTTGPIRDFHDVWGATASDVWAVGDGSNNPNQGSIWHYNGTAWSRGTPPTPPGPAIGLRSVYGFSATDVYAVGEASEILHYHDPDGAGVQPLAWYQDTSLGAGPHLQSMFGRSGGTNPPGADLFAAGEFGQFAGGLGSDTWCTGCGVNDTIVTSVTLRGGIAFASGPAFVVGDNATIYRQTAAAGAWVLQEGAGQLSSPRGLALYTPTVGGPVLFIADEGNERIRAVNLGTVSVTLFSSAASPIVIAAGGIATVAGGATGLSAPWGDGSLATAAELNEPSSVSVDPSNGDIYVGDTFHDVVRRIDGSTGVISTVAGIGTAGFSGDAGAATSAQLVRPVGVTLDRTNATTAELYIADSGNQRVRVVNLGSASVSIGGVSISPNNIDTVAGNGTSGYNADGLAPTATSLAEPVHVLRVGTNLYIADSENHRIRAMPVSGASITMRTVAGTGQAGFGGDPKPATFATLNLPSVLAWDAASGTLYVADTDNSRIRRFRP